MRALELNADDAEVHRILGAIKLVKREFESALYHHERARELCPSDPHILAKYATMLIYIGENEKALSEITKAKRIDPFCPDILFEDEGICYYWLQNYGEAVSSFSKLKIPTRNSLFYLAATYIKANNIGQAKATLAEAVSMSNLTVEDFIVTQSYKNEIHSRELLEALKNITAQT
jgi:adenylate cyclase